MKMSEFYYSQKIKDFFGISEDQHTVANYDQDQDQNVVVDIAPMPVEITFETSYMIELEITANEKIFKLSILAVRTDSKGKRFSIPLSHSHCSDYLFEQQIKHFARLKKFSERFLVSFAELGESADDQQFESLDDSLLHVVNRLRTEI